MARKIVPLSQTLALDGTVQSLPAPPATQLPIYYVYAIFIQVPSANTGSVFIGSSGAANIELSPGDSFTLKGVSFDNGTQAYMDPENFFVQGVNGENLELIYNPDAELRKGSTSVNIPNPLPVTGTVIADQGAAGVDPWLVDTGLIQALTDAELRAVPVDVLGPLTDAELRAAPVDVLGPLTDAELRAAPIDVLGPLTDAELRAVPIPVSGPLTDVQLRATPVPVTSTPQVPAAQTVKQAAVSVGTSAVRLTTDGLAPSSTRRKLQYMPDKASSGAFYVGSSSVTSSGAARGTEVFPGQLIEELDDANDYYIISDTTAQTVLIVEVE